MNIDSIENIKDGNQNNIDSLNKLVINTTKYNDYQLELDNLSATLKADFTQNDLLIELEKLINTTKQTDNGLDRIIKQYYEKIKNADFTQDPILRAELQTKIDDRKIDIVTAHNNYKTEKIWIKELTHISIKHENALNSANIKEYEIALLTGISTTKTQVEEVLSKIVSINGDNNPDFNKKNFGKQDYIKNVSIHKELQNADNMANKEIVETIKYLDDFVESDNLTMILPGQVGTYTFKNKADKLFYILTFYEALRDGVNINKEDSTVNFIIGSATVVGVGYVTIKLMHFGGLAGLLTNTLSAGGSKIIAKGIEGLTKTVSSSKKTPSSETVTEPRNNTSTETKTSSETKAETVSESKEGITRNQKLELIEKYKESKLKLNTTTYNEVFLELNELESKIKGGKLDKLNKIQFANVLMYLDTESHLEYRGGKSILGIKPHKMKEIDIRTVESFIKDVEIGEQKTSYTFEGSTETIEFSKLENLDKNFSKIESKLLEVSNLEKAKELQIEFTSHNDRLTVIQGNKATTTPTLSSTTGTRTNTIENPTYKQILVGETNAQEKIEKTKLEYTKLGYSNIETFDINAEITTTKRVITTEINAINRTIGLTRTNRISLSTGTNWVKELKTDIIKAIKHR